MTSLPGPVVMRPPQRTRRTHARERVHNVERLSGRVCYPPPLLPAPLPLHPPHYMSVSEIVTTAETTRKTPLYLSLKNLKKKKKKKVFLSFPPQVFDIDELESQPTDE